MLYPPRAETADDKNHGQRQDEQHERHEEERIAPDRAERRIAHLDDNVGARHAKAIYDDIQESGTLDESKLNIKSEGFFMAGLRAPMALRLMHVGKMNPLESHPVNPEVKTIAAIVKAAEKEEE